MSFDANQIYDKLAKAGEEWAEAEALASQLEEMKKVILSQLKTEYQGSDAAKETQALADDRYGKHIDGMVIARRRANSAKVRFLAAQAWVDAARTVAANKRAELKALGG